MKYFIFIYTIIHIDKQLTQEHDSIEQPDNRHDWSSDVQPTIATHNFAFMTASLPEEKGRGWGDLDIALINCVAK